MALAHDAPETPVQRERRLVRTSILALMGVSRMTQTSLGKLIGLTQGPVSQRLAMNGTPFNEDELATIADHFGLTVGELYDPEKVIARMRCIASTPLLSAVDGTGKPKPHVQPPLMFLT